MSFSVLDISISAEVPVIVMAVHPFIAVPDFSSSIRYLADVGVAGAFFSSVKSAVSVEDVWEFTVIHGAL